jgi:hypothetical protein
LLAQMTTKKYGRSKALRSGGAHTESLKQIEKSSHIPRCEKFPISATKMPTEIPGDRGAARSRTLTLHAAASGRIHTLLS